MSYSFKITKDADGIRLEQPSEGALQHIPDGTFTITGHAVAPGWLQTETIGVRHADPDGQHVIGAIAESTARKNRGAKASDSQ
jgi:hypothetical protein